MSGHIHDDCVDCLQKKVRELQAALDESQKLANHLDIEATSQAHRAGLYVKTLIRLGIYEIGQDGSIAKEETCETCGHYRRQHGAEENCPSFIPGRARLTR